MRNNIANRLVIHGTREQVNEVLNFIQSEKVQDDHKFYGLGAIDFNKIVPMSDHIISVNITHEDEVKISMNFVTPWSHIIEQMVDLSAKFTSVIIDYGWSDYQFGDVIGYVEIKAGYIGQEGVKVPKTGTKEICELAEWIFS